MKKQSLNHAHTPPSLSEINVELEAVLQHEPLDDAKLLDLVDKRHVAIDQHLGELDSGAKKLFVQKELVNNDNLSDVVKDLQKHSLRQVSDLLRGKKAIEKYK